MVGRIDHSVVFLVFMTVILTCNRYSGVGDEHKPKYNI